MAACSTSNHLSVKEPGLRGSRHNDCVHARLIKSFSQHSTVRQYSNFALRETIKRSSSVFMGHVTPNCGCPYIGSLECFANILSMRHIYTEYDRLPPLPILLISAYKQTVSVIRIHGLS